MLSRILAQLNSRDCCGVDRLVATKRVRNKYSLLESSTLCYSHAAFNCFFYSTCFKSVITARQSIWFTWKVMFIVYVEKKFNYRKVKEIRKIKSIFFVLQFFCSLGDLGIFFFRQRLPASSADMLRRCCHQRTKFTDDENRNTYVSSWSSQVFVAKWPTWQG